MEHEHVSDDFVQNIRDLLDRIALPERKFTPQEIALRCIARAKQEDTENAKNFAAGEAITLSGPGMQTPVATAGETMNETPRRCGSAPSEVVPLACGIARGFLNEGHWCDLLKRAIQMVQWIRSVSHDPRESRDFTIWLSDLCRSELRTFANDVSVWQALPAEPVNDKSAVPPAIRFDTTFFNTPQEFVEFDRAVAKVSQECRWSADTIATAVSIVLLQTSRPHLQELGFAKQEIDDADNCYHQINQIWDDIQGSAVGDASEQSPLNV